MKQAPSISLVHIGSENGSQTRGIVVSGAERQTEQRQIGVTGTYVKSQFVVPSTGSNGLGGISQQEHEGPGAM